MEAEGGKEVRVIDPPSSSDENLEVRIAKLEGRVEGLTQEMANQGTALNTLIQRIKTLEQANDGADIETLVRAEVQAMATKLTIEVQP